MLNSSQSNSSSQNSAFMPWDPNFGDMKTNNIQTIPTIQIETSHSSDENPPEKMHRLIPLYEQPIRINTDFFPVPSPDFTNSFSYSDKKRPANKLLNNHLNNSSQSFSNSQLEGHVLRRKNYKWTEREDEALTQIKNQYTELQWKQVAVMLSHISGEAERTADQVSQHWIRVLNPEISKGKWSVEEDQMLIDAVKKSVSRNWKDIAQLVTGRTDTQVRYRLKQIGKRLVDQGILLPEQLPNRGE